MRLSIKEKAGIVDASRIFEGLHLSGEFIENMADEQKRKELDREIIDEGEKHLKICEICRNKLREFEQAPKERSLSW